VRLTVKVTVPAGIVITANAATMADTPDPNMANNTATVSMKVQLSWVLPDRTDGATLHHPSLSSMMDRHPRNVLVYPISKE